MAKTKKKKEVVNQEDDIKKLPQNILHIGEHVEEDKNIYISQSVYKEIHKFTINKTENESGGFLVGKIVEELGKANIIISGFIEAKYSTGTPTTLTFTQETWNYLNKELEKKYSSCKVLGWIHTHPDFGIFLSEYDKFIQTNFFNQDYQVAYVIDPIQNIEGFYFWINGNIEKCKGFYIYDKLGAKINIEKEKDNKQATSKSNSLLGTIIQVLIIVLIVISIITNIVLSKKVSELQQSVNNVNMKNVELQQELSNLELMLFSTPESGIVNEENSDNTQIDEEGSQNE